MSWTLCTSGAAIAKAGDSSNTTIRASGACLARWSDEAEGRIVGECRRDWVDNFSSADAHIQHLLTDVCSSLIAKQIIQFDMSGYTSRAEAQTMFDVQDDTAQRGLGILKDFKSNTIKSL